MSQEATYANGESILSQSHAAGNIEPAYANGESGDIPFDKYVVAAGGNKAGPLIGGKLTGRGLLLGRGLTSCI